MVNGLLKLLDVASTYRPDMRVLKLGGEGVPINRMFELQPIDPT